MQWAALLLLVALLVLGSLAAMARQGRLPSGWTTWFNRRPSWVPAPSKPGLTVLDRVRLSRDVELIRVQLEDGTRLTMTVGAQASVVHTAPPAH